MILSFWSNLAARRGWEANCAKRISTILGWDTTRRQMSELYSRTDVELEQGLREVEIVGVGFEIPTNQRSRTPLGAECTARSWRAGSCNSGTPIPCQIKRGRIIVAALTVAFTFGETADLPWSVGVLVGSVGKNCGTIRAWITCSKPEASLMSVGSLKAVPVKVMPTGSPNEFPMGTLIAG